VNDDIDTAAYSLGREILRAARRAASALLGNRYPNTSEDDILVASQRGMRLYQTACELCQQIHQGAHTAEAARELLRKRCPGFSDELYQRAFTEAFADNR
jgi:hypothetical protein